MSSRAPIFGHAKEPVPGDDKLLDLYWNRAELKKAYAEAKDEQYELRKCITEHKGSIARLQQQREHLERLLLDPEWVHSVSVHYQLRALNKRCSKRLANFAEQLKQQREKRQHQRLIDTWNDKREGRRNDVTAGLQKLDEQRRSYEKRADAEQARFESMNLFARLFKRRTLQRDLGALQDAMGRIDGKRQALLEKLEELKQGEPPGQSGLDIAAKRSINFMILAFAHQLYIQFGDDNLASLVKESGDKSVGAIQYGDKSDCDRILGQVKARWTAFDKVSEFADILQQRARLLAERALFMQDDDAVPVAGSIATLIVFNEGGAVSERNANLLGENYWGLSDVLSR